MLGYARSDKPADLESQTARLRAAGASRVISEPRRYGAAITPQLDSCMNDLRPGELVAVASLLALGADLRDIFHRLGQIRAKGAHLIVLQPNIDSRRGISLFEAADAFAQALSEGAPPPPFHETAAWARTKLELQNQTITADQAAARHGVSRATVYRYRD